MSDRTPKYPYKLFKDCLQCGKKFGTYPSKKAMFCSHKCKANSPLCKKKINIIGRDATNEEKLEYMRKWWGEHRDVLRGYDIRYRQKYPMKNEAHQKVYMAIKAGIMKRLPCEVCGDLKSQGHHADYSKPFEVKWLCQKHHAKEHKKLRTYGIV